MDMSDKYNTEIRLVTPRGQVYTIAGDSPQELTSVSHDGYGSSAVFCGPSSALDSTHNILYVDDSVCGIRKVELAN